MAKIPTPPHCAECGKPWITDTGDWRFCIGCPYFVSPSIIEQMIGQTDDSDYGPSLIVEGAMMVILPASSLADIINEVKDARRQKAEVLFRTIDL